MQPHDEFLELCAVSTSGELSEQEKTKLEAHLVACAECRQALREFEAAVDVGVPLLASKLAPVPIQEGAIPQRELVGLAPPNGADSELPHEEGGVPSGDEVRGFAFAQRKRYRPSQINWNYVWMPFAACVLLTIALGISAYRVGKSHNADAQVALAS